MRPAEAYHFIKYNEDTSIEHIHKKMQLGAEICFDLEDGISDAINPHNNYRKKKYHRKILVSLLQKLYLTNPGNKFSIRINTEDISELELDLETIALFKNIKFVFLPKINTSEQYCQVISRLKHWQVEYEEIIPVIENKEGILHLPELLSSNPEIRNIVFGHCDYNLSINAFPFFHQDSLEYWKWVEQIVKITNKYSVTFINSPYMYKVAGDVFLFMLQHLSIITQNNFGQITLTSVQTNCVKAFEYTGAPLINPAKNRLDNSIARRDLIEFIQSYENKNNDQAVTIFPEGERIVSPHEYISAKRKLSVWKENNIYFSFFGGCFPVQHNIPFEDIFHQKLKSKFECAVPVNFHVNIIRYSRLANCMEKLKTYCSSRQIDYLVFHIRPEPYLRICKLYYKYIDYNNRKRWSLHLPFLNRINAEKYDMMFLAGRYISPPENNTSLLHKKLIDLNYFAGMLLGNKKYAKRKYFTLIQQIIQYADKNKIKIFILGPGIRSTTKMELSLSKKLGAFMAKKLYYPRTNFIKGIDAGNDIEHYFDDTGVFATQEYHDLIADEIYRTLKDSLV